MRMRHLIAVILVLAGALAGLSLTATAGGKQVIEGILVDTKCYAQDNQNWKNDHGTPNGTITNCGTACASMGIPVGILEDGKEGGRVLVLLLPSRSLAEYVGEWARVTGEDAFDGSLMVDTIEVKGDDGTYRKIEIITMM